mgnify:CR=1 FL=1|tara:strand:- start:1738 stop:1968 length:231 start_codon:yes stop_codon:yes gene_type:complete
MTDQRQARKDFSAIFKKWYSMLVKKYAREVLDGKCSLELAARKVSYKSGIEDVFEVEKDLIEIIKKIGYISQTDFT